MEKIYRNQGFGVNPSLWIHFQNSHTNIGHYMTYQSTIGKAISLLNQGLRLPHSMVTELREQGIDVPSFYQFHMKK
jgi:hypothetical protein